MDSVSFSFLFSYSFFFCEINFFVGFFFLFSLSWVIIIPIFRTRAASITSEMYAKTSHPNSSILEYQCQEIKRQQGANLHLTKRREREG